MKTVKLISSKEWQVILNTNQWRIGLYRPKFRSSEEITELEQHSCPESFLLIEGELTMLYRDEAGMLIEKPLVPGELVTFSEPHAGFSENQNGMAFVIEDSSFETIYTNKENGQITRTVAV